MLRTYADIGLLTPAAVDPSSGYRYYHISQVAVARTIGLLRNAEVPLTEIRCFLADPTTEKIEQWEHSLDDEAASRRKALIAVRSQLPTARGPRDLLTIVPQSGGMSAMELTAALATDRGPTRESNQDALLAEDTIFAVADGMGCGGEIASHLAVETLAASFLGSPTPHGLRTGVRTANHAVWRRIRNAPALGGMGTTVAAIGVVGEGDAQTIAIANVGDSRAYVLRAGMLQQLTTDHTVVADLVRSGDLDEEAAREHPRRAVLTRILGLAPDVEPDVSVFTPQRRDRVVLCSDGLSACAPEEEVAAVLNSITNPRAAAEGLITLADQHSRTDDISLVIIDVA